MWYAPMTNACAGIVRANAATATPQVANTVRTERNIVPSFRCVTDCLSRDYPCGCRKSLDIASAFWPETDRFRGAATSARYSTPRGSSPPVHRWDTAAGGLMAADLSGPVSGPTAPPAIQNRAEHLPNGRKRGCEFSNLLTSCISERNMHSRTPPVLLFERGGSWNKEAISDERGDFAGGRQGEGRQQRAQTGARSGAVPDRPGLRQGLGHEARPARAGDRGRCGLHRLAWARHCARHRRAAA